MSTWRWLAVGVVTYTLCHHLGALPDGLGQAGRGTRWTDWLDLAVPLLVLGPLGLAVRAAGGRSADWVLYVVGAVGYAQGHGIHLAGNSIGNAAPGPVAHLWDEPVGHHVWFVGLVVVWTALARVIARHPLPAGWAPWLLAAVPGVTWGTNALGGGTEVLGVAVAVAGVVHGLRHRHDGAALLAPAGLTALVTLAVAALVG